jgi:hypothetical protein
MSDMRLGMFLAGMILLLIGGFAGLTGYLYISQTMSFQQIFASLPPDLSTTFGLMTVAAAGGAIVALIGLGLIVGGASSRYLIKSADPLLLKSLTEKEPVPSPNGYPENVVFCQSCGRPVSMRDEFCAVCGAKVR